MKKLVPIILLFLLVAFAAEARAKDYRGYVVIKNSTLAERNDTLYLAMEVLVKQNSVMNHAAMQILPELLSENNSLKFPDILILGNNKCKTYNRWAKTHKKEYRNIPAPAKKVYVDNETDTLITYSYQVPYQNWMDEAQLIVNQELIDYRDQRSLVVIAMDSRIKLSPRIPYTVQPLVNYIEPAPEIKQRTKQGQAFLDFQVGRSALLPGYRRNPQELEKIQYAFEEIQNNKDVTIRGVFIEGYASPEGPSDLNERLARDRAYALKNYIVSTFGVDLPDKDIKVKWVAEDWDGLKVQVEASDLRYKDQVLQIINDTPDIDQRKQKIKRLANGMAYRMMAQDIFPQLRRVEYQIDFSVRDFTIEETKLMLTYNSQLISHLELFRAARTYNQSTREFENIMMDIAPQLFPNDPIAYINAAAALISRGEYGTARRYLERYEGNPAAWNNLGVVYMINGEYDKSELYLKKAQEYGTPEAKQNLEELSKKLADNDKLERYNSRKEND